MKVKVQYSKSQLNAAVNYIDKYNSLIPFTRQEIREEILKYISIMAESFPSITEMSSMGFYLKMKIINNESIDCEDNLCIFYITVDPDLVNINAWDSSDVTTKTITIKH